MASARASSCLAAGSRCRRSSFARRPPIPRLAALRQPGHVGRSGGGSALPRASSRGVRRFCGRVRARRHNLPRGRHPLLDAVHHSGTGVLHDVYSAGCRRSSFRQTLTSSTTPPISFKLVRRLARRRSRRSRPRNASSECCTRLQLAAGHEHRGRQSPGGGACVPPPRPSSTLTTSKVAFAPMCSPGSSATSKTSPRLVCSPERAAGPAFSHNLGGLLAQGATAHLFISVRRCFITEALNILHSRIEPAFSWPLADLL